MHRVPADKLNWKERIDVKCFKVGVSPDTTDGESMDTGEGSKNQKNK